MSNHTKANPRVRNLKTHTK